MSDLPDDIREVIDAWDSLPEAVETGVVAMVKAAPAPVRLDLLAGRDAVRSSLQSPRAIAPATTLNAGTETQLEDIPNSIPGRRKDGRSAVVCCLPV